MRSIVAIVACLVCVSPFARAGDFDDGDSASMTIGAGMPGMGGMNIQIDVNEGGKKRGGGQRQEKKTTRREEISSDKPGESFKVVYEEDSKGETLFKFLAPEGAKIVVKEGWNVLLSDEIPATVRVHDRTFYEVQVGVGGEYLNKKFEGKEGMIATFWVKPTARRPDVQVVIAPPPPPAPAPAPAPRSACMDAGDFGGIKEAIEEEAFSEPKVKVLKSAMSDRSICVAQVVEVIGLYSFSADKIAALKAMAPAITDTQNRFKIYSAFTFDSDKDAARKILER